MTTFLLSLLLSLCLFLSLSSAAQPLRASKDWAAAPAQPSSPAPSTTPASPAALLPAIGVCLSGMEYGRVPGTPGSDYAWPTADEYQYFHSKGFTMARLPFKWERMWPTLGGQLDPFFVQVLHNQLAIAATLNITLLLDCHNYARWNANIINGTNGPLTSSVFADFWLKMATEFRGSAGLHGYDLMNEPNTMPNLHVWPEAAQAAINAIRTVDKETPIYVEGNNWSGASSWIEMNPDFPLTDPSDRLVYSCHCYLDRDNSGTHFNWDEEVAHGVTVHTGEERLAPFVNWTRQHKVKAHLGEMGIGSDRDGWFTALNLSLAVVAREQWEMTYWVAGAFYHYVHPMGIDRATVQGRWQDQRQMAPLAKYAQSDLSGTTYFLAAPATGPVGSPSANITLDVRAYIPKPVTVQCYDGASVDSFWRATSSYEFNWQLNFTYTAKAAGQYQLYCTNSAGWIDAPSVTYTART